MEQSKKSPDGMQAALLLCLLVEQLLRASFGGTAAMALRAAVPCALVLGATGCWFAWSVVECRKNTFCRLALQYTFVLLLAVEGAVAALNVGRFCKFAYGSDASLLYAAAMAMAPLLFLKKKTSLAGAGSITLLALATAFLIFFCSVFGRLRAQNLQFSQPGTASRQAVLSMLGAELLAMRPEYLLPAFWYTQKAQRRRSAAVLPLWNLSALAILYFVLELLFGADLQNRLNPFHSAAALGAVSVFERMEWAMLMICTAAVSIKLALYMVSAFRIFQKEEQLKASACGPVLTALLLFALCLALQRTDLNLIVCWLERLLWGMVVLTCFAGTLLYLSRGPRRGGAQ